ncbi:AMP-binding protein [Streptomyces sp. PKU-MA01144]|uniref:AMP-binding protein n=1 Tax=Streptomyces sp. PKU-MA01144 TaxID=2729138 RepID=UPI00147D06EB|nr:AMP-binding protein [Streptomyces sp. PKU-MA01144]NNJ05656.1 AMP-binding protein [Streptomyces sp. PKU-MA01144]
MSIVETDFLLQGSERLGHTDLAPFQRAALGAGRRLSLRVRIPGHSITALAEAIEASVAAAPVLTAVHVPIAGLRVPRQRSEPAGGWVTLSGGGRELTGGSLRITLTNSWDGPELSLSCATDFADTASVNLLLEDTHRRLTEPQGSLRPEGTDFFAVAQGHNAMVREGELVEEERFWAARRSAARTGDLTLAEAIPVVAGDAAVRPVSAQRLIDPPQMDMLRAVAEESGCIPEDIAFLALAVVVRRLGMASHSLALTGDARDLMGLPALIGPLTQVVPTGWDLDLRDSAAQALEAQRALRTRTGEMLGGPALTTESDRLELVFDNAGAPTMPPGWYLTSWSCPVAGDITVSLRTMDGAWRLYAETAAPAYQRQVDALLTMWAGLLADLVAHPSAPLAELGLLPAGDAARVAKRLSAGARRTPSESLANRFLSHVLASPEAPSCRRGDRVWTYGETGRRVAAVVAALGDIPIGGVVAVVADPEHDLLASLLAVSWKGAVFLPLSPQEPEKRLRDALERSGAGAVLLGSGAPDLTVPLGCRAVRLAEVMDSPDDELGEPAAADGEALAYLLRTSGSTGVPKLVGVTRNSLDNYLHWAAHELLEEDMALPVLSSPVFDASFKQTLGVVYQGGCVWLLAAHRLDLAAVRRELAAANTPVTLNCVPSYLSELLADDEAADGTSLAVDTLMLGGEPLDSALVRRIRYRFPRAKILNLYGPTETTATATVGLIPPGDDIHVGTPVAGARLAVVDAHGAVVPEGVRGEVVIAGPGLAVGYLSGHEGVSPFADLDVAGRRIAVYHTGDFGVLDATGSLRLFGRRDSQIKLRGWRIDPREVERVAQQASGVRDAIVVLDDRGAEPRLCAFVTGTAEAQRVSAELRATLPGPMVPESVAVLDRFPTTATGKVDRPALLARASTQGDASPDTYNPQERLVATAWREVVGQGWPGRDDDFFNVGGHSLLLARLVNLLRARGCDQLSLRQVVRHPTVASIAALISAGDLR